MQGNHVYLSVVIATIHRYQGYEVSLKIVIQTLLLVRIPLSVVHRSVVIWETCKY